MVGSSVKVRREEGLIFFLDQREDLLEVLFLSGPELLVLPAGEVAGLQAEVLHLLDDGRVLNGLLDSRFELLGDGVRQSGRSGVAAGGPCFDVVTGLLEGGDIRQCG